MIVGIVLVHRNLRCHRLGASEWSSAPFWCVRVVVGTVLVRQNGGRHRFGFRNGRRHRFVRQNGRCHRLGALEWSSAPLSCVGVSIVLVRQNGRRYLFRMIAIVLMRENSRREFFGASKWSSALFLRFRVVVGTVLVHRRRFRTSELLSPPFWRIGMVVTNVLVRRNGHHRNGCWNVSENAIYFPATIFPGAVYLRSARTIIVDKCYHALWKDQTIDRASNKKNEASMVTLISKQ